MRGTQGVIEEDKNSSQQQSGLWHPENNTSMKNMKML